MIIDEGTRYSWHTQYFQKYAVNSIHQNQLLSHISMCFEYLINAAQYGHSIIKLNLQITKHYKNRSLIRHRECVE